MSDQECSICQYHWHCPVDANGYMPCEPDYKGVADAEAKARDYVATLEPPFSTGYEEQLRQDAKKLRNMY